MEREHPVKQGREPWDDMIKTKNRPAAKQEIGPFRVSVKYKAFHAKINFVS